MVVELLGVSEDKVGDDADCVYVLLVDVCVKTLSVLPKPLVSLIVVSSGVSLNSSVGCSVMVGLRGLCHHN